MARAATSPELTLFRTPGQWSRLRAAIYVPATVYTALVNQTFSTADKILQVTYDTGSGTLADVKADMTMLIGSTAGGHDRGIVRIRKTPTSTIFHIGENSDVVWADNLFLTVIADFDLWPKHLALSGSTPLMDGDVAYSNQHSSFDPVPMMGSHRVVKLTGATVATAWDGAASWVYDSTISAYAWAAATASATSGMATATPTITFNAVGWHVVYLTVTAANGKTFQGARYVYVWNDANRPASAEVGTCSADFDSGGWSFSVTFFDNVSLAQVRERALVILFAEDYYGTTAQSIGPLVGCENIIAIGRITSESIEWNPEQGSVEFAAQGSQYWFGQIKGFPSGLLMVTGTPVSWIEMGGLTVGRALWHFLHWRTTATRMMDITLTSDARLQALVSSMGGKLWEQMTEFAFNTIMANLGVDRYGRLYAELDPQIIPEAERTTIPVVMTITKPDRQGAIDIERRIVDETGVIDLSGVSVNSAAHGSSFFSLAPGHVMKRFGDDDVIDRLSAFSTQDLNNDLAGRILGWRNNQYPDIPIELSANNRLFDCWPNQYASIVILAAYTPRGIAYSGKLIPRYVGFTQGDGGFLYTEVSFEAEIFEQNNTNGDIPFSASDTTSPPLPSFPPLPDFPITLPGFPEGSRDGPKRVLFHDPVKGIIYCQNFWEDSTKTLYATVNAGLTAAQYQSINAMFVTPNGALYVARVRVVDSGNYTVSPPFIARAPAIGATFTILYDESGMRPGSPVGNWGLYGIAYNPLVSEQVAFVKGAVNTDKKIWIGSGSSFAAGAVVDVGDSFAGGLSYGLNNWLYTRYSHFSRISANAATVLATGSPSVGPLYTLEPHTGDARASTTGRTFHGINGSNGLIIGDNNLVSTTTITDALFSSGAGLATDPSGLYLMGRQSGGKNKSSDAGTTWSALPSLPVGNWFFQYAGGAGVTSRWIAAGAVIRYTPDFGVTWQNKESASLNAITFTPAIDMIRVIEL
ncbi:MAG: hypothetical protein M3R47_03005 [Chloroflexota bacterium]|nr:hypothetical protein [Chloroflexota bacterium]